MRILQLIDSLEAGGAERMAVNYANALSDEIELSALVSTRAEGSLKSQISNKVSYLFLNRKRTIDLESLFNLKKFVKQNQIKIVHAHSSSCFLAVLLKIIYPKIEIFWHDHYGNSEFLDKRNSFFLKIESLFFSGIISVNNNLLDWSRKNLLIKKIQYFPNFVLNNTVTSDIEKSTILNGNFGKRIICLANLRPQKGHFFLLEIANKLRIEHKDWTFHLVGKDFKDNYSQELKDKINHLDLNDTVFLYDSRNDIVSILKQSTIGVLTSQSEGLPVALLEYGMNHLPVVVTNVGEIQSIIKDGENGFLVEFNDLNHFVESLKKMIENIEVRVSFADSLQGLVVNNYSKKAIIDKYLNWIEN